MGSTPAQTKNFFRISAILDDSNIQAVNNCKKEDFFDYRDVSSSSVVEYRK